MSNEQALHEAQQTHSWLKSLSDNPDFKRWERAQQTIIDAMGKRVLGGTIPAEDREDIRIRRLERIEVLNYVSLGLQSTETVLEAAGIKPGALPEDRGIEPFPTQQAPDSHRR